MTNEKLAKLQDSLEKAETKVTKSEATITRYFAQVEKKINSKQLKQFNLDFSNLKYGLKRDGFLKQEQMLVLGEVAQKLRATGTDEDYDLWYELSNLETRLEDINQAHHKLTEALQVVNNWETKLAKEIKLQTQSEQTPQVILDFLNKWEEMAFEWHMENVENAEEKAIKEYLTREKQVKLVNLTSRVEAITGTITDARGLQVSPKGDLTGVIVGEKGTAQVQSIVAGGWNIQCYHIRTLVNAL